MLYVTVKEVILHYKHFYFWYLNTWILGLQLLFFRMEDYFNVVLDLIVSYITVYS